MRTKSAPAAIGLLALAACAPHSAPPAAWSFERQVGLVAGNCLSIRNPSLAPGSGLWLVNAMPPQEATPAHVAGPDTACAADQLPGYRVEPAAGPVPAIAIAGFAGAFTKEGGLVSADLDREGGPEFFRACTSTEGVHFTIWAGEPLTGRLRWHRYYYLGYDVEPNCKPEESGPAK